MRYILFILIAFQFLGAQQNKRGDFQMPGTGIIVGEVLNADTSMPIEYAAITLINSETQDITSGQLTDNNGIFIFKEGWKVYYSCSISKNNLVI